MGIKVTREMLDRYRKLKQEIPVLELELLMMKNTEAGLGNDTIFDYQTGYPRPQSVVGFDQKKYDRREKVLERKKEKVKVMDQWIDDIKDGQTRCVFRMFYKQNMTWKAIAKQIGMPHNEDYPRLHIRDAYTPQGRFYQCTGQPAHPFLYPALHDNEDKILKNMKASFQADIGKESK